NARDLAGGGAAPSDLDARRLRDLRSALSRRRAAARDALRATPRAFGRAGTSGGCLAGPGRSSRGGQEPARGDATAGPRRSYRQAARLLLRAREAQWRVAEDQAPPEPGVRDRRLAAGGG